VSFICGETLISPKMTLFEFIVLFPSQKCRIATQKLPVMKISTASTMATDSKIPRPDERPVYTHWFAVEVYNQFSTSQIEERDQNYAKEVISILKSYYKSSNCVSNTEPLYTALLARVLDRYRYPNNDGCCLHQPPLKTETFLCLA